MSGAVTSHTNTHGTTGKKVNTARAHETLIANEKEGKRLSFIPGINFKFSWSAMFNNYDVR